MPIHLGSKPLNLPNRLHFKIKAEIQITLYESYSVNICQKTLLISLMTFGDSACLLYSLSVYSFFLLDMTLNLKNLHCF